MKKTELSRKKQMYLPQELLSEILSRLDVDSLLRFKTVCKSWRSLIEDPAFIGSHIMKSRGYWVYETHMHYGTDYGRYYFVDSCFGLILEQKYCTKYYRLRNPCTRKIFRLPDPGVLIPSGMKMCHIRSSDALKLVVPSQCLKGGKGNEDRLVLKVLTVGNDITWRNLDVPFPRARFSFSGAVMVREAYFVLYSTNDKSDYFEAIFLEMGDEQISSIAIPNSFLSNWPNVTPLAWGGSLALGSLIKDEVHIWVLEDHKQVRWAEKEIIIALLNFADPQVLVNRVFWACSDDGLLIRRVTKEVVRCDGAVIDCRTYEALLLDVPSGKIKQRDAVPKLQTVAYYHVPSLYHPKGSEILNTF